MFINNAGPSMWAMDPEPLSFSLLDPDPHSICGSESRWRGGGGGNRKMTTEKRKFEIILILLKIKNGSGSASRKTAGSGSAKNECDPQDHKGLFSK